MEGCVCEGAGLRREPVRTLRVAPRDVQPPREVGEGEALQYILLQYHLRRPLAIDSLRADGGLQTSI